MCGRGFLLDVKYKIAAPFYQYATVLQVGKLRKREMEVWSPVFKGDAWVMTWNKDTP